MSRRQDIWREYERAWLRKHANARRFERIFKKGTASMDTTVVKIAKGIAETGEAWLSEAELTEKIFNFAQHDRRVDETPEQAFARHFNASDEQGLIFRKAVQVAKTGSLHPFPRWNGV
jgi:hypothetical protein